MQRQGVARQRGYGATLFLALVVAGYFSHSLLAGVDDFFVEEGERRRAETRLVAGEAAEALRFYMLSRSDSEIKIAQGPIRVLPRLLMLPCPDNVGDGDLDGTQDPYCGKEPSGNDLVNKVLNSGSRFGRLPWTSRAISLSSKTDDAINDGLARNLKDPYGNRLWYAVSRNMTPWRAPGEAVPLNFHRLATKSDGWLKLVNAYGVTVASRAAAVALAPGVAFRPRFSEGRISQSQSVSIVYSVDVDSPTSALNPQNFFEAATITLLNKNGVKTVTTKVSATNYNRDGVFINARHAKNFNDGVAAVDIDHLLADRLFMQTHARIVGVDAWQNTPRPDSPLARVVSALSLHYSFYGFFPPPAVAGANAAGFMDKRFRGCAAFDTGGQTISLHLPAGVSLLMPATATASLGFDALLAAPAVALVSAATVVINDARRSVASVTLGRYARVEVSAVSFSVVGVAGVSGVASVGATVVLLASAAAQASPKTPLAPAGHLRGWLPKRQASIAINAQLRNYRLNTSTTLRASFWQDTQLTSASGSIAIAAGAIVSLHLQTLQFHKTHSALKTDLAGNVYFPTGATFSLPPSKPDEPSFNRRGLVALLLVDAVWRTITLHAPLVLWPWREERRDFVGVESRDNAQPYPPCLDLRNLYENQFRLFVEDQPIFYAVAQHCHYGGNRELCEQDKDLLTVSLAAGAALALPQPISLTNFSFTVSALALNVSNGAVTGNDVVITADWNGTISSNPRVITITTTSVTIFTLSITITTTVTTFTSTISLTPATLFYSMSAPQTLSVGSVLIATAGSRLIAGDNSYLWGVRALLIYSPAPLSGVDCLADMPPAASVTMRLRSGITITVASQKHEAADISPFCYWLDDEENADNDNVYILAPPTTGAPARNDYMLLFGGRLRL